MCSSWILFQKRKRGNPFSNQWTYLTRWGKWELVTEPPLTLGKDLSEFREKKFVCNYPCHTQSVERRVALSTKSTSIISGYERQLGEGLATEFCRNNAPGRDCVRERVMNEIENIEWNENLL